MENGVSSDSAVPSSPSAAIFSDELQLASSPLSSPPGFPWEQTKASPIVKQPLQRPTKTAFSVLGKRKALEPFSDNVQSKKRAIAQPKKSSTQTLTQMQISLGQEVQKRCKTCGMEYIQSSSEDRELHDKYHKQNTEGYDVGRSFVEKARPPYPGFKPTVNGDIICILDCFDKPAHKRRGQAVLKIVQRELGAVEIPEKTIWDYKDCQLDPTYRAFLYIRGTKCIGFLLTQRIKEAYRVVEPQNISARWETQHTIDGIVLGKAKDALRARLDAEKKILEEAAKRPIELSKDPEPAGLGVSRIWTSAAYRQKRIASRLLDAAFSAHNYCVAHAERIDAERKAQPKVQNGQHHGIDVTVGPVWPKATKLENHSDLAFSQPTEAGAKLARRWTGKMFGWKVYMD